MKLMQIGSSLVNMTDFISVEARSADDGVVLRIEHANSVNEYLVPYEIDPELVASVVMECVATCAKFDLIFMLRCRRVVISYDDED